MKYNIFGSALVLATTVLPEFVQGAPTELHSNITQAITAGGVSHGKNVATRDVQFLNNPSTGGPYAIKFHGQGARPSTTTNFIVENGDPSHTICIWAEYGSGSIPDPERPGSDKICLDPGQSLQFGNIPEANGDGFSGTLRGYTGCDGQGHNCHGGTEALGAVSKIEWTFEPQGRKGFVAINQSLVDGYNLATEITYGPGNDCIPLKCSIPRGQLQQICPAASSIWDRSQFVGCKSQCATYNTDEYCGRGSFQGEERCPQSSKYFIEACPAAMAFAHDHQKPRAGFPLPRVQYCDAKGEVKVKFSVAE